MQARDMMISEVHKVKESDTVRTFIETCIAHRISGMPVVNDRNEIVAFLSDGDIMRYIGKHEDIVIDTFFYVNVIKGDDVEFEERVRKIVQLPVMQIATKRVIKVSWTEELENVAAILGKKQIKKVPVERDGVLVGIISRGDVIRQSFKALM